MQLRKIRNWGAIGTIILLSVIDIVKFHSYGIIAITIFLTSKKKVRKGNFSKRLQKECFYLGKKDRILVNSILGIGSLLSYLMARNLLILLILPYLSGVLWGIFNQGFARKRNLIKQRQEGKLKT